MRLERVYTPSSALLDADAALVLLQRSRDALEAVAAEARLLVGDMDWQSEAVGQVHESVSGIAHRLFQVAEAADRVAADVLARRLRHLAMLEMFASHER